MEFGGRVLGAVVVVPVGMGGGMRIRGCVCVCSSVIVCWML